MFQRLDQVVASAGQRWRSLANYKRHQLEGLALHAAAAVNVALIEGYLGHCKRQKFGTGLGIMSLIIPFFRPIVLNRRMIGLLSGPIEPTYDMRQL